jgi:hypothetical protein
MRYRTEHLLARGKPTGNADRYWRGFLSGWRELPIGEPDVVASPFQAQLRISHGTCRHQHPGMIWHDLPGQEAESTA